MRNYRKFLSSENGSFAPAIALSAVPLLLAMGIAVDYTSATTDRAQMQNALDSAVIAITTMEKTATDSERQTTLQNVYSANGGPGSASLKSVSFDPDGTMHAKTSASYAMPTDFMSLARIKTVNIDVATSVRKNPSLIQAEFRIEKVSGYWNKTITLYGTRFGQSKAEALMQIDYKYNGKGGTKGYGTTTMYTKDAKNKFTVVNQQQECTTENKKSTTPAGTFPGPFVDGDKVTTCVMKAGGDEGAKIDVSQMNDLYLQMDVPSASPSTLKTNDPKTSDRLYIGDPNTPSNDSENPDNLIEVEKGNIVDIFTAVPCEQTSKQAWEDGGNAVPAHPRNADFFYSVTGKCDFNKRPSVTSLVQ